MLSPVQLQGTGNGVQDTVRDTCQVSALQPGVVVHADAGQPGHFLTPQPRHPAPAAVRFQPCLFGGDASAAG
jgi:hypothetical protein